MLSAYARSIADDTAMLRRCPVPDRIVGDRVVTVRPGTDQVVTLQGAAAVAWIELDHWTTEQQVEAVLAEAYPEVSDVDRRASLAQAIILLDDEGLLERREP